MGNKLLKGSSQKKTTTPTENTKSQENYSQQNQLSNAHFEKKQVIFGVTLNQKSFLYEFEPFFNKFQEVQIKNITFNNYSGSTYKNDSTLIICGGISHDLKEIKSNCIELNLQTYTIKSLSSMNQIRYTFPICYFEEEIYAIGGRIYGVDHDTPLLSHCEKYSYKTGTWKQISNTLKPRCTASLAIVNQSIWVFGGFSSNGKRTKTIERYNKYNDIWEKVNFKLAFGVDAFNIVPCFNNKNEIIFFGGKYQDNTSNKVIKYNMSQNTYKFLQTSTFDNLIAKVFKLRDDQFLIVGEKSPGKLVGNVLDTDSEQIIKEVVFGEISDFNDLKKLNFSSMTFSFELTEQPQKNKFKFDMFNRYPNKNQAEIQFIEQHYNRKNIIFGTDNQSFWIEFDSKEGKCDNRMIPTSMCLYSLQGIVRISPTILLFCGGVNTSFTFIHSTTFLLNLETAKVERLPDMQIARYTFPCVIKDNFIYAIGGRIYGQTGTSIINSVERFCLIEKTWKTISSLNISRCTSNAHVINGNIYVFGGYTNDFKRTSSIETYNERTNRWEGFGVNMKEPMEAGITFQQNDVVYYFGGKSDKNTSNKKLVIEMEKGDLGKSVFLPENLKDASFLQKACLYNNYLFIFGGVKITPTSGFDVVFKNDARNVKLEELFPEDAKDLSRAKNNLYCTISTLYDKTFDLKHTSFVLAVE